MLLFGPLWVFCGSFVGPLWSFEVLCGSFAVLCGPLRSFAVFSHTGQIGIGLQKISGLSQSYSVGGISDAAFR